MKKGVAIPYIIAILLGIAVIGLIGFWLFKSTGIFGAKTVEQECRSNFLKWCQEWLLKDNSTQTRWITTGNTDSFNKKYPQCALYKHTTDYTTPPPTTPPTPGVGDTERDAVRKDCFVG